VQAENTHILPDHLYRRSIHIHVFGCGGTGSQLLPRLAQLHKSLLALGHPHGLHVTVWDEDTVSENNCLRQNFYVSDVGFNKAIVMVNRLNIAHGLLWEAAPEFFTQKINLGHEADFLIGCVDSKASRREIAAYIKHTYRSGYWMDAGNGASSGQMIVGQFGRNNKDDPLRLPLVTELYPEIIKGKEDNAPSCSARESLLRQGIGTNAMAAMWMYAWLCEALQHGRIGYSGVFFNLATGRSSPIPVDPRAWDAIRGVEARPKRRKGNPSATQKTH
jgi:PRTRC genetic system ThiF family protein